MLEKLLTCEEIKAQLAELETRRRLLIELLSKRRQVAELQRIADDTSDQPRDLRLLVRMTADAFGVEPHLLRSLSRRPVVCAARFAAWYVARELTAYGSQQLASLFNRDDHSTVLSGVKSAADLCCTDPIFRNRLVTIRNAFLAAQASGDGVALTTNQHEISASQKNRKA